jgi:uncharacterized protein (TIGR03000 family)
MRRLTVTVAIAFAIAACWTPAVWSCHRRTACCLRPSCPALSDCPFAIIVVRVSHGAKVYFEDQPTQSMGEERTYITPPLTPGISYTYQVKAEINLDGDVQTETRTITVQAFSTTEVDFTGIQESSNGLPMLKELPKLPEAFFPPDIS